MKIPVGTLSVLVGVHQFLFHPITVWLAFRRVHKRWPALFELVGIALHDIGYWAKSDLDGPSGIEHPRGGAALAAKIVGLFSQKRAFDVYFFCLFHSSSFAKLHGAKPSALYLPDKVSILFEPKWWYLFRARLSGEITEYVRAMELEYEVNLTEEQWYFFYRRSVQRKLDAHENRNLA